MIGALAKMQTDLGLSKSEKKVQYQLPVGEKLIELNPHIGETIHLHYQALINCRHCRKQTKKSFSQGYCYPCFRRLACCDLCMMKPETCHFAQGTCREPQWGQIHCFKPHYVYLANSSGLKVGITRDIPTRWIDQGATQALPIFKVANRLQSGLIEMILKQEISDRTDWRKMLKSSALAIDLKAKRDELLAHCSAEIETLIAEQEPDNILPLYEDVIEIAYPVNIYPEKVKSLNFDKQEKISGKLNGIKGQYLLLDTGVLNIRKFAGYQVTVDFN